MSVLYVYMMIVVVWCVLSVVCLCVLMNLLCCVGGIVCLCLCVIECGLGFVWC